MNARLMCLLLLLGFGTWLSLSLGSFHSYDPTFARAFFPYAPQDIRNFGGYLGASCADFLIQFLGMNAWLVPFALGLLAWACLSPPGALRVRRSDPAPQRRIGRRLLALVTLVFCLSALSGLSFQVDPLYPAEVPPGGLLGREAARIAALYLGVPGGLVLTGVLLLVSGLVLFQIDLHSGFSEFQRSWQRRAGERRRRREARSSGVQSRSRRHQRDIEALEAMQQDGGDTPDEDPVELLLEAELQLQGPDADEQDRENTRDVLIPEFGPRSRREQ